MQEKNEVVKKTVYDELVKKANAIQTTDTSNLFEKDDYKHKNVVVCIAATPQPFFYIYPFLFIKTH